MIKNKLLSGCLVLAIVGVMNLHQASAYTWEELTAHEQDLCRNISGGIGVFTAVLDDLNRVSSIAVGKGLMWRSELTNFRDVIGRFHEAAEPWELFNDQDEDLPHFSAQGRKTFRDLKAAFAALDANFGPDGFPTVSNHHEVRKLDGFIKENRTAIQGIFGEIQGPVDLYVRQLFIQDYQHAQVQIQAPLPQLDPLYDPLHGNLLGEGLDLPAAAGAPAAARLPRGEHLPVFGIPVDEDDLDIAAVMAQFDILDQQHEPPARVPQMQPPAAAALEPQRGANAGAAPGERLPLAERALLANIEALYDLYRRTTGNTGAPGHEIAGFLRNQLPEADFSNHDIDQLLAERGIYQSLDGMNEAFSRIYGVLQMMPNLNLTHERKIDFIANTPYDTALAQHRVGRFGQHGRLILQHLATLRGVVRDPNTDAAIRYVRHYVFTPERAQHIYDVVITMTEDDLFYV